MKLKLIVFLITVACVLGACSNGREQAPVEQPAGGGRQVTEEMHEAISDYIVRKYGSVYEQAEKLFEVHKVYGASESDGIISVYMHSYFGGFNRATGLENQAGHSLPAVIRLKKEETGYVVTGYTEPMDGNQYTDSLKNMFPEPFLEQALKGGGSGEELRKEMEDRVKRWLEESEQLSVLNGAPNDEAGAPEQ
ncbi:hypothetical protein [Paenibacillus arenilitoris]|uniref:Uncharacterized protein n=1 Tax=Paenibacillus arenilitoris TaxID=2772299 RepID=A0A927CP94_9BACL|nr:hypothetical protein [Paenibacillus arenilitoris]MBD2870972.1 hypothetical protein [Paenibacillus arenilitoris]